MNEKILKLPDVIEISGLSRSSIYEYAKKGGFPKPIALGPRSVGWLSSEITEWLVQRTAMRGGK